ncbi:hypothetical protein [Clostridium thermobutyricum]|uniref:hypothetical protein n=1 Tax=Clostridium thermobutyricum TaxID=29372 RepID=UPI0018AB66E3|nr:hypothetical protein [Clostridium thermobutyricum]
MKVYDYYVTPKEYEIASTNNISRVRVNQRIRNFGWSKERAITESPRRMNNYSEWLDIVDKNKINRRTFYCRVKNGLDRDRAATMPVMTKEEVLNLMHDRAKKKVKKYPKEIVELARSNGISYITFKQRVGQLKWEMIRAATTPVMTRRECGLLAKKKNQEYIDVFYKLKDAKYK